MSEMPENGGPEYSGEKHYWLDDMRNVHKIFWALVTVCAGLLLADLFYEKHGVYEFEN
ncbi:MAG: hypothetical protein HQ503_16060 [Rhodospirillales bacterium]|nr:hypothetical protein [Rhodospirillales bacterium]